MFSKKELVKMPTLKRKRLMRQSRIGSAKKAADERKAMIDDQAKFAKKNIDDQVDTSKKTVDRNAEAAKAALKESKDSTQ